MKIDRDKSEFLDEVIDQWKTEGLIDATTEQKLKKTYEAKTFDWFRLAQYSFWVAMACGFISLGAFLIDDSVLNYLKKIYDTPDILISILSASIAVWLYYISFKRKQQKSQLRFSSEAILFSAILFTANALAYFGKSINTGTQHFSLLILCSVFIYGAIGYIYKSKLTWVFALISLGAWFGTETGYLSRSNFYFFGMNYPLRFVFFGAIVTALAFILRNHKKWGYFFEVSYICGMVYLFLSLWLLSIFGNFGTLEAWYGIKQLNLFIYAIISAICCVVSILAGLKFRDDIAREFGITFIFLNLYTRYFEYFWDSWHKALFFLVLAASFWLIGRKAEKIWNLEFLK
jgi:hypothetical protein